MLVGLLTYVNMENKQSKEKLTEKQNKEIDDAVDKVFKEYGNTLRMLGKEGD